MKFIITEKVLAREEAARRKERMLVEEHERLAAEHALLLDFAYTAAASKRTDGKYAINREALQRRADAVLTKLNL